MAITKDKKRAIIARLEKALTEASSVAFVGFTRLSVKDSSAMRKEFASKGVRYYVAKKTLLRLALKQRGYEGHSPDLPGEVAVAWTVGDATAPARGIYEFSKKLKGTLTLLGGAFEGAFADAGKMSELAAIPPLPALRGLFANVINSPIQRFATALGEVVRIKQ